MVFDDEISLIECKQKFEQVLSVFGSQITEISITNLL